MSYVNIATRLYGEGRIIIHTGRITGKNTPTGKYSPDFWRRFLELASDQTPDDLIRVAVVNNKKDSNLIQSLSRIEGVKVKNILYPQLLKEKSPNFDCIYVAGLTLEIGEAVPSFIEEYVREGGGLIIEEPNIESEPINILTEIDSINVSSKRPLPISISEWRESAANSYIYQEGIQFPFMVALLESDFPSSWDVLMADVELVTNTTTPPELTYNLGKSSGSNVFVAYTSAFQNGIVEVEPEGVFGLSSSSSSSSFPDWIDEEVVSGVGEFDMDVSPNGNVGVSYNISDDTYFAYDKGTAWVSENIETTSGGLNDVVFDFRNGTSLGVGYYDQSNDQIVYYQYSTSDGGDTWNQDASDIVNSSGNAMAYYGMSLRHYGASRYGAMGGSGYLQPNGTSILNMYTYDGEFWTTENFGDFTNQPYPNKNSFDLLNNSGPSFHVYVDYDTNTLECFKNAGTPDQSYPGWISLDTISSSITNDTGAIAVDSTGTPQVAFVDASSTPFKLKYAKGDGGTGWNITTIESSNGLSRTYMDIAVDSNNNPHISYINTTNGTLKYARYDGVSWNTEVAATGVNTSVHTKISVYNDKPIIGYVTGSTIHILTRINF